MPIVERPLLMGGREDFAALCNDRGLKTAVEVGTDRGVFARAFLDRWLGEMLYCVDPYSPYPHMQWNRQGDLLMAVAALTPHASRVRIICATSKEAASYFSWGEPLPTRVGFVYLDGDHRRESVMSDIEAWWPLIQPGGILAGDDFGRIHPGVKEAVVTWANMQPHSITINLISNYNREDSWFVEKPR